MSRRPLYGDDQMVTLTVTLPETMRDKLQDAAIALGQPMSALVRELIIHNLENVAVEGVIK